MESAQDLIGELHAVIDRLLALDTADAKVLVAVQAERARLAVATAQVMHRWEQLGHWQATQALTPALALAGPTRACHRATRHELGRAAKLARMPHTRAAILDGRLSLDHLDLFCQFATQRRMELFLEHEATLVAQCAQLSVFDDARKVVRYWADHADALLEAPAESPLPSAVYASRSHTTGHTHLFGELSAIDGEIVTNELHRLAKAIRLADQASGVTRSPAQRRAAALVQMATRSTGADGPSTRPLFQVVIGDQTAARLCELASGVVLRPEDLAGHIDTALMESFLFDTDHTILGVSDRRTFTGRLRRAIQVRDLHCQHSSGCPVPATYGDIDHCAPHGQGGETSQFNGRALCVGHNRYPHLRDHPPPRPARPITHVDQLRRRMGWRLCRVPYETIGQGGCGTL